MKKFKKKYIDKKQIDAEIEEEEIKLQTHKEKGPLLSEYDLEKLNFLNNSKRIMPNGASSAHLPINAQTGLQIKLYESIKTKMQRVEHRKLQLKIRGQKEDHKDKYVKERPKKKDVAKIRNSFDDSYLKEQEKLINPKYHQIIKEDIEKKGRPALVIMDMAQ